MVGRTVGQQGTTHTKPWQLTPQQDLAVWPREAHQQELDANKSGGDQDEEKKQDVEEEENNDKMRAVEDDIPMEPLLPHGPRGLEAHPPK